MYSSICNRVVLPIILICSLILSTTSLSIKNCQTNRITTILGRDPSNAARYHGKVDAELSWNKTYGVALVRKVTFYGVVQYNYGPIEDITLDIASLKAVRIQRFIKYSQKGFEDIVEPQCSLGFIYDNAVSLDIPYALEDGIISEVEKCIEDQICNFDPESHRIGDDIHVKSNSRQETTSQETINAATDFIVDTLIRDLVKVNKSLLAIPQFDVSAGPVGLNSTGGLVNILKYIKREDDLSFQHEGRRYVIDSVLTLTGGDIQLHNVSVTSPLGSLVNGELPINMTGASLRMQIAFDYIQNPCRILANNVVLNVPSDQVDFSSLKISTWFFETNVDTILKTLFVKSLTVSAIASQLEGLLKDLVEGLSCEDYRDMVFKLEGVF